MKKFIVLSLVVLALSGCDWRQQVKCYARYKHACVETGGNLPPEQVRK